jgi:serine protease Do
MAKALGLDAPRGALIGDVEPQGPAERVGMHAGDVVLSVDGEGVARAQDLPRLVARHAPGSSIHLGVLRDKSTKTFDVTLESLKEDGAEASPASDGPVVPEHAGGGLGLRLGDAPNGGARVEGVRPDGAAAEALAPGDVIVEVNRTRVTSAESASRLINKAPKGEALLLKVRGQDSGRTRYVAIERP